MADEKRLIAYDPITFESFIRHATKHIDPYYDPYGEGFTDAVDSIEGWLNNNTVDAVEVVHGRWLNAQIEVGDPFGYSTHEIDVFTCSICGVHFDVSECRNYCPNCGAKMYGGNEDEM